MVCNRANNGDGAQWGNGTESAAHTPVHDSLAHAFIAAGIDDLAKYHVMRLLYEHPDAAGDASYFARFLGFHSVGVTATLLDDLVAAGVLAKDAPPQPTYRLAARGDVRRHLLWLYNSSAGADLNTVLRALATRSLEKARYRARAAERQARGLAEENGRATKNDPNEGQPLFH